MKKILTLQTGIVFLITILIAGGCSNGNKLDNTTKVEIYVKAKEQDGRMHLEMYNAKHPDKKVVDSLYTDVLPGYTVIWKKVDQSGIKKVNHIRPIKENGKIFSEDAREVKDLYQLIIPPDATPGIEKYEIVFTDKDGITWCIDPYLRIPD